MKTVFRAGASLVAYRPLFSPDGKYLFCCCGDTVKTFSITSGECVYNLSKHTQLVTSVKLNPRNSLQILTSSLDGTIIQWDYQDGIAVKVYKVNFPVLGLLLPKKAPQQGKKELTVYAIKGNPDEGCQLVQFNLHHHQNTPSSTKVILNQVTPSEKKIGLGYEDEYLASLSNKKLYVYSFKTQKNVILEVPNPRDRKLYGDFTCLACHPREYCIATGLSSGRICLWRNFFNPKHVVMTYHHWHSLSVNDLSFTQEGSYLLSGGHECVLVRWQNNMQHKDFMPRLGAPIERVTCSPDNTLYATSHSDNVIQVIGHALKIQQHFQGLAKGHLGHHTANPVPTGLLLDPRTKALVLNGKPGHLQFYLIHMEKHLFNLDIVGQNYISPENIDKPTVVTEVEHAAFDPNGDWLVTVERRDDGETSMEMRLKFWMFDKESQGYVLNTNVDLPHSQPVNTLKFRPRISGDPPMAVTTSDDRKFKLWCLVDDTDIYRSTVCWNCDSVGFYRDYPASDADFSEDGSLLAVAFKLNLTLWDPDSNALRTRFDCMAGNTIKHVLFGQAESSHFLVATTETNLIVWNILTCSVYWSIPLSVSVLIANPGTELMAAFTKENTLFVFRPQDSSPDYTKQEISKHAVVHAIFVPRDKPVESDVTWHQQTQLYFIDEKQSLLSLSTEEEVSQSQEDIAVTMQQNLPQTPYSLLMSQTRKTGVEEIEKKVITGTMGEPGAEMINQLLHTPAHVLPPITTLCNDFVSGLLISKLGSMRKSVPRDQDDDDDDDSSESEASESEQSDMETETPVTQQQESEKHEGKSADSSENNAEQLEINKLSGILPSEFSWMKSVFSPSCH